MGAAETHLAKVCAGMRKVVHKHETFPTKFETANDPYRALVRARWDDAAESGFNALCVHARATSRPILERLGFEKVAEHEILRDPATC